MNIDWFTFVAQVINFLVLVALLRWFLYRPVVMAMRKRQEKISDRLREAEAMRQEAEEKTRQSERIRAELQQQREEALEGARQEASRERRRLLEEARGEVEEKRQEWRRSYRRELEGLLSELSRKAGQVSLEATRRALSELADSDLEERMCRALAERLEKIGPDQGGKIAQSLSDRQEDAVFVRSAFQLSQDSRKRLMEALARRFGYRGEISFEQTSGLICGLEMDVGGYALGWNVDNFLQDLEGEFSRRLREEEEGVKRGEVRHE